MKKTNAGRITKAIKYIIVTVVTAVAFSFICLGAEYKEVTVHECRDLNIGSLVSVSGHCATAFGKEGEGFSEFFYLYDNDLPEFDPDKFYEIQDPVYGIKVKAGFPLLVDELSHINIKGQIKRLPGGEVYLEAESAEKLEGSELRTYYNPLNSESYNNIDDLCGSYVRARMRSTLQSFSGNISSFILFDEEYSVKLKILIEPEVYSRCSKAKKDELLDKLRFKNMVTVYGYLEKENNEYIIRPVDCEKILIAVHYCKSFREVIAVEPSCGREGLKRKTCNECERNIDEVIPALTHSYPAYFTTEKNPTCTEDGLKVKVCKNCKDRIEETIPKTGHSYGAEKVEVKPTCVSTGLAVKSCSKCSNRIEIPLQKTSHSYGTAVVERKATCINEGLSVITCKVCGQRVESIISITPHTYSSSVIERKPTCVSEGLSVMTCKVCEKRVETALPKTDHSYSTEKVETKSTCVSHGLAVRTCSNCSSRIERELPLTAHSYGVSQVIKKADCNSEGLSIKICSYCGDSIETSLPKTSHSYSASVTERKASCTDEGLSVITCKICGDRIETVIPKTGHSYSAAKIETQSTCVTAGTSVVTCKNCGDRIVSYLPLTAHSYTSERVETPSTCITQGTAVKTCEYCSDRVVSYLPLGSHSYSSAETVKKPSCTEEGKSVKTCKYCSDKIETSIEKINHEYISKIEKQPTCLSEGISASVCKYCSHRKETVLPKTEHNYTVKVTKASFDKDGKIEYSCKDCFETKSNTIIPSIEVCELAKDTYIYSGKEVNPEIKITLKNNEEFSDYTVQKETGKDIGKYKVKIILKGNYEGQKTLYYTILPKGISSVTHAVSGKNITLKLKTQDKATGYKVYCGETLALSTSSDIKITLKDYAKKYDLLIYTYVKTDSGNIYSKPFKYTVYTSCEKLPSVSAASGFSYVTLKWNAVPYADGYRVYIFDEKKKEYTAVTTTSKTSYTFKNLAQKKSYTFAVKPYMKRGGNTLWSEYTKKSVATQSSAVSSFKAKEDKDKIILSWSKIKTAKGYRVYLYNEKTKKYKLLTETTKTTFELDSPKKGTKYRFAVKAFEKVSDKKYYGSLKTCVITTKPGKPVIKITRTNSANTISWSKLQGASGYEVYYSKERYGDYRRIADTKNNSVSHKASGRAYYKVRAYKLVEGKKLYGEFCTMKGVV